MLKFVVCFFLNPGYVKFFSVKIIYIFKMFTCRFCYLYQYKVYVCSSSGISIFLRSSLCLMKVSDMEMCISLGRKRNLKWHLILNNAFAVILINIFCKDAKFLVYRFWGFYFLFVQCLVDVIWIGPCKVYLWFGSEFFEQMIACCGMCVCHVCASFHMMDMWNVLMTERENYLEMNEPLWMLILSWNNYHLVVLDLFVCILFWWDWGFSKQDI